VFAEAGSTEFYSSTSVFTPPDELPVVDVPLSRSLALQAEEAQKLFTTVVATPDGRLERLAPSRRLIGELMRLLQTERRERLGAAKGATRTKVERGRVPGDDRRAAWREIDLLEEGMMTPKTVIGDDTREPIADTIQYPFRAIGRISMGDASCTGTLIGPRHVLTAGHCVYDIETDQWYEGLEFAPGQNGPNPPFGTIGVSTVLALDGWVTHHQREFDIAMLVLDQDVGEQVGWMGFAALELEPGSQVIINGYPGDKPEATMWHAFCPLEMALPARLYYGCDTFGGMSGSAVHAVFEQDIVVYGVHVSGGETIPSSAQAAAEEAARMDRERFRGMTFEQFEAAVYKEPFEDGKYIVNGDTAIVDRKHLEEFFQEQIRSEPEPLPDGMVELIVHQVGGLDAVWNSVQKHALTYCVSTTFGDRYDAMVADMTAATGAWEEVADVDFIHLPSQDAACTASNQNVVFDVRPVDVDGQYSARAFFPNDPRFARNILVDQSSFELSPTDNLQLVGILRHELGHTLGFRHEHTRPESGACFEDANWRPLTDYDAFSVMHYPQCNGRGDWSLTLTSADQIGAACLYEPAPGFELELGACPDGGGEGPAPMPAEPVTASFENQSVIIGQERHYGPLAVATGTVFEAEMMNGVDGTGLNSATRINQAFFELLLEWKGTH